SRFGDALDRYGALGWMLGGEPAARLSERLRAPREHRDLMIAVATHGEKLAAWRTVPAVDLLAALRATGATRRADWFRRVAAVVAVASGASLDALLHVAEELRAISSEPHRQRGLAGAALGHALRRDMLARIDELRR